MPRPSEKAGARGTRRSQVLGPRGVLAAIEKARPAHRVGMLVQIEKLVGIDYR